jgi:flagellar biosynthesis/type III secretory pathway protein FliH
MNPFNLHVSQIRAELPVGGVIPANRLDAYVGTAAVLARARDRAAAILRDARRRRLEARLESAALLARAHEEGRVRAAAQARAASAAAVAATVRWLIDAHELEARVAASLESRCRQWVAETVNQFAGEADRSALIATRIQAHIRELSSHGRFSIRLSHADFDAVLARLPEDCPFEAVADPAMRPGEACLDSPFVRLHLDLDCHLAALLTPIGGVVEEPVRIAAVSDTDADAGAQDEDEAAVLSPDDFAEPIEARSLAAAFDRPDSLERLLHTSAPVFEAMMESSADGRCDAMISRARGAAGFGARQPVPFRRDESLDDMAEGALGRVVGGVVGRGGDRVYGNLLDSALEVRLDALADPWADVALRDGAAPSPRASEIGR